MWVMHVYSWWLESCDFRPVVIGSTGGGLDVPLEAAMAQGSLTFKRYKLPMGMWRDVGCVSSVDAQSLFGLIPVFVLKAFGVKLVEQYGCCPSRVRSGLRMASW